MRQQGQHTKYDLLKRKEKLPLEMDREPRKSVAPCCLQRGVFYLVLFVGEGKSGVRDGVAF
jgi:hypothetical protein